MKQVIGGFIALALLLAVALITAFPKTYDDPLALTEKIREEINQADADTIAITWAGGVSRDDRVLFWLYTGNEYQAHVYYPVECRVHGTEPQLTYEFVHIYNDMKRAQDIGVVLWRDGYAFCVNNPNCRTVRITDNTGTHDVTIDPDALPYVFYNELIPQQYLFLDAEGKEMR